ncbi:MAG TPA: D-alanyl-D-alanine carboxypeptidase family protein [Candidatus Hydrogenedentes bacterium]|nr:D-alanyl-D-alanine carboxypeptidase family protein [Candidatus Hydrogenedentota bacterium]HNT86742.1 D-alanyl-D-alanine carboxypeptidase family protein [Candidatus Hydrogenedentota bacterium]
MTVHEKVRRVSLLILAALWAGMCPRSDAVDAETPESRICVEASTGLVVAEQHADIKRPPASMVKLVMMLLVAEGLDAGVWREDMEIGVSAHAQHMGGTQVYLEAGQVWPLDRLMQAVAIASANDAAMAVAEGLWGSKEQYLEAANRRAAELGMVDSTFNSVHGLPPDRGMPFDETTARDMATLARECVKHPRLLAWTREKELEFKPGQAISYNTNKMLWRMPECDGLKTGYIRASGYCVTATAARGDTRIIAIVMGSPRFNERFQTAKTLLETGFAQVRRVKVADIGQPVATGAAVEHGMVARTPLYPLESVWVVVPPDREQDLRVILDYPPRLAAPLKAGDVVGELWVELDDKRLGDTLLYVAEAAPLDLWSAVTAGGAGEAE